MTETAFAQRIPRWARFGLWLVSCFIVFWLVTLVFLFAELPSNPVRDFLHQLTSAVVLPVLFFTPIIILAYIWHRLQIIEGDGLLVGMFVGVISSIAGLFGVWFILAVVGTVLGFS